MSPSRGSRHHEYGYDPRMMDANVTSRRGEREQYHPQRPEFPGRRPSPTYDEYPRPEGDGYRRQEGYEDGRYEDDGRGRVSQSYSQPQGRPGWELPRRPSPAYGDHGRLAFRSREYHSTSITHSGYSNYRRVSTDSDQEANGRQTADPSSSSQQRRSASPSSAIRGASARESGDSRPRRHVSPPFIFRAANLTPPPPPPPPRRTDPTEEYLSTSLQASWRLTDPKKSRKLIVLDLNGSLLLRGAHQRRPPVPRSRQNGPFDPYADPTQLRQLRAVHPRPYLSAFRAYVLHEETKNWLDTMVWSSAQPHSVQDMVDKCFQERKSELKAVWARDTLGLSGDDYHKKSLTLKDLAKPWTELFSPTPEADASAQAPEESEMQRHSALTTLLVDDSPLKAALQPWNHLCIREYVQEMRRWDLGVAEWETAKERAREAREALEAEKKREQERREAEERVVEQVEEDPNATKIIREVVMIDGKMIGSEEVVKKVVREVVMIDGQMVEPEVDPNQPTKPQSKSHKKRKLKRLVKKEYIKKAKEELEREALLAMSTQASASSAAAKDGEVEEGEIDVQDLAQAREEAQARAEAELKALEAQMRYDETLLAVIGVLDHIKHEGNVAGWMRSGGLLHVDIPADEEAPREPESRSASPSPETPGRSPAKKRRIHHTTESDADVEMEIQATLSPGSAPPPSSPPSRFATEQPSSPAPRVSQSEEGEQEEQASTGVPLGSPKPQRQTTSTTTATASHMDLWYERSAVMTYWANRGRQALKELDIEAESGIVAVPALNQM